MPLEIAKTIPAVRSVAQAARQRGQSIGLVPTMGALHAGHASLVQAARRETDYVIVSIFVNPAQFGPREDLARYPRTWEEDLAVCSAEGANIIFAPTVEEVYPADFATHVEVDRMQDVLEGAARPGHFRGVATVVAKLFHIVAPDVAYFGQKDAQQARIIRQMVRDLNLPVQLRICPTVREVDGLALSSRNRYLSTADRRNATCLHRALQRAEVLVASGERDARVIREAMLAILQATPGAELDYVELVNEATLLPISVVGGTALVVLAVRFGDTRLIDNIILETPEQDGNPA